MNGRRMNGHRIDGRRARDGRQRDSRTSGGASIAQGTVAAASPPRAPCPAASHPDASVPAAPDNGPPGVDRDAAETAEQDKILARRAYRLLAETPLTADEVAEALGRSVLSIRPRLSELAARGLIEDSGSRRPNASGRRTIVWRVRCAADDSR